MEMYPFDANNYESSTKYVIHHALKVLDINQDRKLVLCDSLTQPKEKHTPVKSKDEMSKFNIDDIEEQEQHEEQQEGDYIDDFQEELNEELNEDLLIEDDIEENDDEEGKIDMEDLSILTKTVSNIQQTTSSGSTSAKKSISNEDPMWLAWVPEHLVKGATVIQGRARGMIQRRKDKTHGIVTVEFSTGLLGIELENRIGKFGATIRRFAREPITGDVLPAERSNLLEVGMTLIRVGEEICVNRYFSEVLTMVQHAPRPVTLTFGLSHSKALQKADRKYGQRSSKLTNTLRRAVENSKRIECQEDILTGKGDWESLLWLGYDSHRKKDYTHSTEYLLHALRARIAHPTEGGSDGHAGMAGSKIDMSSKFWKILSKGLLLKWKEQGKGNMKDMTECHKCFEVALGYLENASDPEVWHDMTDVYTRHGAIHSI